MYSIREYINNDSLNQANCARICITIYKITNNNVSLGNVKGSSRNFTSLPSFELCWKTKSAPPGLVETIFLPRQREGLVEKI